MTVEGDQGGATPWFLAGGGEMGRRMRAFDWAATPISGPETWPEGLRTLVALMLDSRHGMFIAWGPSLIWMCNDAFMPILADKGPGALGAPTAQVWADAWPTVGPLFDQVLRGEAQRFEDLPVPLVRDGETVEAFFNFSYNPVRDGSGTVGGVYGVVTETTDKVRAISALGSQREQFARLFDQAPSFMAMLSGPEHRIDLANPAYMKLVGHRPVLGLTVEQALPEAVAQGFVGLLDRVYQTGEAFVASNAEIGLQHEPGGPIDQRRLDFVYQPIRDADGQVSGIFLEGVDVTERAVLEQRRLALVELGDRIRDFEDPDELAFAAAEILGRTLNVSRAGYGVIDKQAETITIARDWNAPGIQSLAGVLQFRDYGTYIEDLKAGRTVVIEDAHLDPRSADTAAALKAISAQAFVNMPVTEAGDFVALLYLNHAEARPWSEEELALVREVADRTRAATERRRVETELRNLAATLEEQVEARTAELRQNEEALRQAQKMEAVGQLTGGLAHDFNNLLAAVSGNLELLEMRLRDGRLNGLGRYIDNAQGAARRAAALTQRLLAFSRRQTLDPRPTDVNRLIGGMEDLIRRSVGPDIEVEIVGAAGLWAARIDPSQLENSLLNLCINARDAMAPDGGRITIETANTWLDQRAAAERDLLPGQYLSICITDTGSGMTPEVIARAFDPFFTTKPLGEGTGLGLSMVYGFARQSGGQVRIYSEVGQGTTMCLYLPRFHGEAEVVRGPEMEAPGHGDGETVLVIDDEPAIRALIVEVLRDSGYRPLEAADGPEGLKILATGARVDLLITDVGLPGGMNGRQVADAARVDRPDLKVLFITGYAENAAVGNGHLAPGMEVMTKPFAMAALGNRIRDLIERQRG
ncbi:ATP-binding protein [Caulobacter sp. NIBR1757]|uniref:ATP-binding protein n=1 Tax=Caulobacter sp. NIBR1757 TaxID=3016000 RepID=UPI0022F0F738|nr:ATP-binding protein [Caulobacter sp. NIBR1757]WGM37337.1 Sensor histidine kinase RcsC [Caulobacter sp. NIBR1757]